MSRFEKDWKALDIAELPANQQSRLALRIKRGDVTSVYPMIVKAANESWYKLPPHTRQWYTKEEYTAAGVAYTATSVAKVFDKTKGVKFSTFLQTCLTNFYNTIESEPLRAEKRWEGSTISFDTSYVKFNHRGITKATSVEFYVSHSSKKESPDDEIVKRLDATKGFLLLYDAATVNLRKYLIKWFLTSKVIRMREGQDYHAAKKELAVQARRIGFTCQMGIFLANNDLARAECALQILKTHRTNKSSKFKDQYSPNRVSRDNLEFEIKPTAAMAGVL
jgi:hypothetical protein